MSASRLVMARTWGLPFTLLKSTTGPPSRCFCTPVISKSGSTSTSVLKTSPCVSSHSSAERREVISFATSFLVSSANTVAMISLLLFYVEQTVSLFLLLNRELDSLRHKITKMRLAPTTLHTRALTTPTNHETLLRYPLPGTAPPCARCRASRSIRKRPSGTYDYRAPDAPASAKCFEMRSADP